MTKYLLFVLLFTSGVTHAQLLVKLNPAGFWAGPASGSAEIFLNNRISASLDGYWLPGKTVGNIGFYGGGAGVSGRFYATRLERPRGLFLSPFVAEQWIGYQDIRSIRHNYHFTALGGQAGFQWVWQKIISLEIGAGGWSGLNVPVEQRSYGVNIYYGEGFNWWVNVAVGVVLWTK